MEGLDTVKVWVLSHLVIGVLKHGWSGHGDLDVSGHRVAVAEVPQLAQLPPEGSLIGHRPLRPPGLSAAAGVLECGGAGVVVHEVGPDALGGEPHFPAGGKWFLLHHHALKEGEGV